MSRLTAVVGRHGTPGAGRLAHVAAAVGVEDLTGDVTGLVAREEHGDVGDVFRLGHLAEWYQAEGNETDRQAMMEIAAGIIDRYSVVEDLTEYESFLLGRR